jgi:hypothetical protein
MRGGGKRKQPPASPESKSSSSSLDEEWEVHEDRSCYEEEDEDDEAMLLLKMEKPMHERVMLEVQHVELTFEKFSKCPDCHKPLTMQLNTECV